MNKPESGAQAHTDPIEAEHPANDLVTSLRSCAPYVHAHRGRTFVIHLPGEAAESPAFAELVYDIALLHSLGVRVVLAFGARPQIDAALTEAGIQSRFVHGLRITDKPAMRCVKQSVGRLQMELEALLSTSLASTPMGGARISTASGNLVTARPMGVAHGCDHEHTGEVRRIDTASIEAHLARGHIVLLSCVGYSPSGEIFNLLAEDVARAAASALTADKLVLLHDGGDLHERLAGQPGALGLEMADTLVADNNPRLRPGDCTRIAAAAAACRAGVHRAHLVSFDTDGALLRELYSRDGAGTLIMAENFDSIRAATPEDLGGILALIEPLAEAGVLVARSREQIELDIPYYIVMVREGLITACCALIPYPEEATGELTCVAVHPDYRNQDRAAYLLAHAEQRARANGVARLFALTTRTPHWFVEHGFAVASIDTLPVARRALYNHQRNSTVLVKSL